MAEESLSNFNPYLLSAETVESEQRTRVVIALNISAEELGDKGGAWQFMHALAKAASVDAAELTLVDAFEATELEPRNDS